MARRFNAKSRAQRGLTNLQAGTYSDAGEKLAWSIYDKVVLATGNTVTRLFQAAVGSAGKTLADTNMTQAGAISQGQNFQARVLRFIYTPATAFNLVSYQAFCSFLTTTVVEVVIGNKAPVLQATLAELMGVSMNAAYAAAVAGSSMGSAQTGFLTGCFPLNIPINLAALTPFEVRLTYTTAVPAGQNGDSFQVSMQGRLVRAI